VANHYIINDKLPDVLNNKTSKLVQAVQYISLDKLTIQNCPTPKTCHCGISDFAAEKYKPLHHKYLHKIDHLGTGFAYLLKQDKSIIC